MTRLPRSLDDLHGLRAARWVRESTAGQADNFGPDAQRELATRAIERYGLVDVELEYSAAHSGRTIAATGEWAAMVAAAGDTFDVLVVGYVSRFARDLETAVTARRSLHAAGAVILFADERILTSDEEEWERWAREAVEAEAYSRRLGKRIREGYAAKRRRLGVPGGNRAPLGTIRTGRELEVDGHTIGIIRAAYDNAAAGLTDREIAALLGLRPTHVAEILTNPFYRGNLRTGEPSALGPIVDVATWERAQAQRARYSRRHRGSVRRRQYSLAGILACRACGRHLSGHVGRYRHVEACPRFRAARPRRRRTFDGGTDHRIKGESYRVELYEEAIAVALEHVRASSLLIAETVALATTPEPVPGDALAAARLSRERDQAALRYARDRDLPRLEATMRRLDAQERASADEPARTPTPAEARAFCEDLPGLWRATDVEGRRAIALAVFERVEVLGVAEYWITPTLAAMAHGWDTAFGAGAVAGSIGRSGRGERDRAGTNDLPIVLRLSSPPRPPLVIARSA